jgi:hypothetical protein
MKKFFIGCMTFFLITACLKIDPPLEVTPLIDNYFSEYQKLEYSGIFEFYSDEFYQTTSRKNWEREVEMLKEKKGPLETYKLHTWQSSTKTKPGKTIYILLYIVKYEKILAEEKFVIEKDNESGLMLINAHSISSRDL